MMCVLGISYGRVFGIILGNVPQTVTFINTRSNNLFHGRSKFKRADMFESGLSGLPKEEHG